MKNVIDSIYTNFFMPYGFNDRIKFEAGCYIAVAFAYGIGLITLIHFLRVVFRREKVKTDLYERVC